MIFKRTGRWRLALMLALMSGVCMPFRASAEEVESAETVDVENVDAETVDAEEVVDPEVNEDSLRYLLLVDTFETAERIPTRRLATPAEVAVVTADEIDANHYQSVFEALSHVNGVVTANRVLKLNGSDRVLILVDGRRSFITPPMKAIERIEIVKGGGSALYGSDAVGGVINIITKKGDHDETTVDINTGSWHRHTYEITNQGNDGKLGWFIDGSISKSRPYNFKDSNYTQRSDLESDYSDKALSLRLDHRFDDRNSLTFDLMHYKHRYNQYNPLNPADLYVSRGDIMPRTEETNQVALAYNFKEGTETPGFLRYFNNYQLPNNGFSGKGKSRLQGVDYQNGWEMGQHKLIVGAECHQSSDRHEFLNHNNNKEKINNQAYYIQDTITMGKWTVIPGTRLDHNSNFGNQWSPKLAANYQPDDQTKIFASWGRAYQAPSALALYADYWSAYYKGNSLYLFNSWLGDKHLNPETGHTETIGIEHDFSDKVNASLSLFNAKIGNFIDLNDRITFYENSFYPYIAIVNDYYYVNASSDKQRGIDLNYRQKLDDHWSYNLGYTYTHRDRPLGAEEVLYHARVPKNSYKASIRYQNGSWRAALLGIMGSGSNGSHYMEDNFAFLDFNISCEVSEWATVYAKAINFTNQNRSYYGRNFNSPGRLFQFGLDCRF